MRDQFHSDPFAEFGRNDRCWCGSARKYKRCHGAGVPSAPGAVLPPDPPGMVYIAPTTRLTEDALKSMLGQAPGMPITMPTAQPTQPAQRVSRFAAWLSDHPPRRPTLPLRVLGRQRFEVFDGLGLNANGLERRLSELSETNVDELAYGVLDVAKATVDRLIEQASYDPAPTTLWSEPIEVENLVGRTLLWADHYVIPDALADVLLDGSFDTASLVNPLRMLLRLRPLIELGLVVPVPQQLATIAVAEATQRATNVDLANGDLVSWVESQLEVEGPTGREALLIRARDDIDRGADFFYLHAHIDPDSLDSDTGRFGMRLLTRYDHTFDYGPWVGQSKQKTAAAMIQRANRELAIASVMGGRYVTRSPFRARLLRQRGVALDAPSAMVWADVPDLPDADSVVLAQIAGEDETVEALRFEMRRAFRGVSGDAPIATAEGLSEDLAHAARQLDGEIRSERRWQLLPAAVCLPISIALSASGVLPAIGGALVGAAGLAPYAKGRKARRGNPAFALLTARGAVQPGKTRRRRGK